jgi:DNA-binding CsgD family transcriptional regulator
MVANASIDERRAAYAVDVSRCIMLVIHDHQQVRGVAGLEREPSEPAFTAADTELLENIVPSLSLLAGAQLRLHALERELAAMRAVFHRKGKVLIVDRDRRDPVRLPASCGQAGGPEISAELLDSVEKAAERLLDGSNGGYSSPPPMPVGAGAVVRVALLSESSSDRRVAVHVAFDALPGINLSRREREIAVMLCAGYTAVNIAATYNLSENTVRTYTRRLYRKLAVNNRADLVRQLLASDRLSSALPPPPSTRVHRAATASQIA